MLLPRTYKSEAEIGVAAPTLSPELLRGVSSLNAVDRQRAVSQQLLSRTVLERVVREEQLSPSKPVEETAARLRAGRREEHRSAACRSAARRRRRAKAASRASGSATSTSRPSAPSASPTGWRPVFVEENSQDTDAAGGEHLRGARRSRRAASQERLAKLQEQLRTKKEAFMGRLPDQTEANIQMVNGMRQQLESISMELRGEQDRLRMVEGQIDAMRQGIGTSGLTATSAAAIQASQARLYTLQQELAQARAAGYTDAHPEIIRINGEMAEARKEANSSRQEGPTNNATAILMADPLYRQKMTERDASRLRIAGLQREASQARSQIGSYQSRVDAAPMVEQELASLPAGARPREGALRRSDRQAPGGGHGRGPRAQAGR